MLHEIKINKSHRSMEVTLPALLGNYDGQTNRLTDRPTHGRTRGVI